MENILIIQNIQPTEFGIKFFINPSQKYRICMPLQNNEQKDLIQSLSIIPPYQNYILINTAINHPMTYHKANKDITPQEIQNNIPQIGQPLLKVIKEFDSL